MNSAPEERELERVRDLIPDGWNVWPVIDYGQHVTTWHGIPPMGVHACVRAYSAADLVVEIRNPSRWLPEEIERTRKELAAALPSDHQAKRNFRQQLDALMALAGAEPMT